MTCIYIAGGPGSGKTNLARRLSSSLTIPSYEMDLIGWENGVGAARPLEVCVQNVHEIAHQTDWVAEGGHHPWIDELLQRAEMIVWLDMPWTIARWRLLTRHFRASVTGTNKHRGLIKLYHFMRHARVFYTSTRPNRRTRLMEAEELQPYQQKTVHCQHPSEVEAFFLTLGSVQKINEARLPGDL